MAPLITSQQAARRVRLALVEEHSEIAKDGRSAKFECKFEEIQCRERRRIADAHMALVERSILIGLIKGDKKHDTKFSGDEVAAATKAALVSYVRLRKICTLPQKPADENAFNKCLMRIFDEQVR